MATVTFDLKDLKDLGVESSNLKETVDRLGMTLDGLNEKEAIIDITPNRTDMLDIIGFSRAVSFLTAHSVPKEKFYSIKYKPALEVSVTKAVKKVQPFIAVAVIKNVNLKGNRLKNLINFTEKLCDTYGRKRKKMSMGMYNLDAIKGPLTYDASTDGKFVPLGSSKNATFSEILKSHEKGVEYSSILSKYRSYPFLADSSGVIALIPIINSEGTRVTESTTNLLIDITATSRYTAESALNLIACAFIDTGAEVYPCEIKYDRKTVITPQLEYREMKIKRSTVEKMLGVYIEDANIINLANKMGYLADKYGNYSLVHVPPYRLDVFNEQDIIEDIAIAHGYDKIEPIPIFGSSSGLADESAEYASRLSKLMIGLGITEAMNPYLTNEAQNFDKICHKHESSSVIKVAYAKTEAITMLRTTLLPWLMENLSSSTHEKMPQKLFEIGNVFRLDGSSNVIDETNFAIVLEHSKANYSEIKSIVVEFMRFAGLENYKLEELGDPAFIEGRASKLMIDKKMVGYFGEIHPKVLENFKLDEPVVAAEMNLTMLIH